MYPTILCLSCLLLCGVAQAIPASSHPPKFITTGERTGRTGDLRIQFTDVDASFNQDSVLVILDKYDHKGPGVVYRVFAPDSQNSIRISAIPADKA